jgi:hypothetical protein
LHYRLELIHKKTRFSFHCVFFFNFLQDKCITTCQKKFPIDPGAQNTCYRDCFDRFVVPSSIRPDFEVHKNRLSRSLQVPVVGNPVPVGEEEDPDAKKKKPDDKTNMLAAVIGDKDTKKTAVFLDNSKRNAEIGAGTAQRVLIPFGAPAALIIIAVGVMAALII